MSKYADQIHQALYPRWIYTGGWITADVTDDGSLVTLSGYTDPSPTESNFLIHQVENSLGHKPKVYWRRIGSSDTPILLPLEQSKSEFDLISNLHSNSGVHPEAKIIVDLKALSPNLQKAEIEAEQNIHALVQVVANTQNAIQNKATNDIQTLVRAFQDTQKAIEQSSQAVAGALLNTDKQAREWLQQSIQGVGEVLAFIQKTVNELWSRYWRDRIIDAIRGQRPHHSKAQQVVKKLKQDYPYETHRQIANRLILEKTLFTTITGPLPVLAVGIPKVGSLASKGLVKFLNTKGLLVEMIYQIGVSYGFDEYTEGDYLVIWALALGKKLANLGIGMDFLLEDSIPDPLIPAVTNVIVFLSFGYAACEFYEAKAKAVASPIPSIAEYVALEKKIEAYLEEAISEKTSIETSVVQAVSIKERLTQNPEVICTF